MISRVLDKEYGICVPCAGSSEPECALALHMGAGGGISHCFLLNIAHSDLTVGSDVQRFR